MNFTRPKFMGREGSPNPPRISNNVLGALGAGALPTEPSLEVHDRL